jgi:hypothetical protein
MLSGSSTEKTCRAGTVTTREPSRGENPRDLREQRILALRVLENVEERDRVEPAVRKREAVSGRNVREPKGSPRGANIGEVCGIRVDAVAVEVGRLGQHAEEITPTAADVEVAAAPGGEFAPRVVVAPQVMARERVVRHDLPETVHHARGLISADALRQRPLSEESQLGCRVRVDRRAQVSRVPHRDDPTCPLLVSQIGDLVIVGHFARRRGTRDRDWNLSGALHQPDGVSRMSDDDISGA